MAPTPPVVRHGSVGRGFAALTTVVLLLAAVGCGLRQDDKPRELRIDAKTKALLGNPSTTSTVLRNAPTDQHQLYLVRSQTGSTESLVPVVVAIPSPAEPADLPRAIIEKLVTGPPVTEDLKTFIPQGTQVLGVVLHGNVLDVDLSKELSQVESTSQRVAVAQIVFTATAIDGIEFVRFSINGSPTPVPLDDKTSEVGAEISRDDFPKLKSGGTTTTAEPTTQPPVVEPAPEGAVTEPAPTDATTPTGGPPVGLVPTSVPIAAP